MLLKHFNFIVFYWCFVQTSTAHLTTGNTNISTFYTISTHIIPNNNTVHTITSITRNNSITLWALWRSYFTYNIVLILLCTPHTVCPSWWDTYLLWLLFKYVLFWSALCVYNCVVFPLLPHLSNECLSKVDFLPRVVGFVPHH